MTPYFCRIRANGLTVHRTRIASVNLENVAAGGFQIMHAQGEVESEDENYSEGDDKVRSVEHRGLPIRG